MLKIVRDTRVQIKYLKLLKNILEPFKKNEISSQENENNFKKNLENSRKTLKMAEHIIKDTHNPKLNILECDRTTPLQQNLVPRFAKGW